MKNQNEGSTIGIPKTQEKSHTNTLGNGEAQKDIKKRFIRLQFDIQYAGHPGKEMDPNSATVPDMHMTVKQLLENHSRGIDSKVEVRQPIYFETEIPTITDITDVGNYRESLENRLKEVNNFIAKEREEKQFKESQERLKKEKAEEAEKKEAEKP